MTPLLGVGVVVKNGDSILLIQRAKEPKKGLWALPGGMVNLGEPIRSAAIREVKEECSIDIELQDIVSVIDLIDKDTDGKIKYHFVLIDFLAEYVAGELQPASDALDAAWISPADLSNYNIPELTKKVINKVIS
ncbi:NUDIX hydrolase [candidate division KSB1 bacterium]|nr:NUDIX hydrolase [candidate division KSB1 bacterium]